MHDRETGALMTDKALCYVGRPENFFENNTDNAAVAEHIRIAKGPSGTNAAYALNLQRALATYSIVDEHVFDVCSRLLTL